MKTVSISMELTILQGQKEMLGYINAEHDFER